MWPWQELRGSLWQETLGRVKMLAVLRGQLGRTWSVKVKDESKWQGNLEPGSLRPGHHRMEPLILPGLKVRAGDQGRLPGEGGFEE